MLQPERELGLASPVLGTRGRARAAPPFSSPRGLRRALGFAHPTEWVLLAAAVALVLRYAWFMDDAFVYLRYVDNCVLRGIGLVYNPGEYVEGFSSPAWIALLCALRATHASYPAIVTGVGVACAVITWAMLVVLERRMSSGARGFPVAMLLLLPNYGVLTHFTSGLEAPLVNLAAVGYALFVTDPRSRALQTLVALSPLVRHELLVPAALAAAWAAWRARRPPWCLIATGLGSLGALALFRVVYYAELLPSTFYLKDHTDFRQGLVYLHDTLRAYHGYETFAALALLAVVLARRGVDRAWRERLALLVLALPVALYCVRIGGDFRHFRYLAFPFVLTACASAGLGALAWRAWIGERHVLLRSAGVLALALQGASFHPAQLDSHPVHALVRHTELHGIEDAFAHRLYLQRAVPEWMAGEEVLPAGGEASFSGASILVTARCVDAYFAGEERVVHSLGLTDALLARTDVPFARTAHKYRLIPLAADIADVQRHAAAIGRGMYAAAVQRGAAPRWVADNLESIEVLERKIYNRHELLENLRLAFTPVGRIDPAPRDPARRTRR